MADNTDQSDSNDGASNDRNYNIDGAGKTGVASDKQPDVAARETMSDRNGQNNTDAATDSGDRKRPS